MRTGRPDLQVAAIRLAIQDMVPEAPRVEIATGRDVVARDLARQRLGAWFFSGFGLIALVLGTGGVFGLVAYLAESRRREYGVRVALGAMPRDLVWRGVGAALVPVVLGTSLGLVAASAMSSLFVSLLHGLSGIDPATYVTAGSLMVSSALTSGLVAAWRLRRVSAAEALRTE